MNALYLISKSLLWRECCIFYKGAYLIQYVVLYAAPAFFDQDWNPKVWPSLSIQMQARNSSNQGGCMIGNQHISGQIWLEQVFFCGLANLNYEFKKQRILKFNYTQHLKQHLKSCTVVYFQIKELHMFSISHL